MNARLKMIAASLLLLACRPAGAEVETPDGDEGSNGSGRPMPEPLAVPDDALPSGPRPDVVVNLPEAPAFESGIGVPLRYDDGAYSIRGLRAELDERIAAGERGTEVRVRAYVQEIYVPPECPEGEMCPPGKQPHLWLTDGENEKGKRHAMLLVNYRFHIPEWQEAEWRGVPEVVVEVGRQYHFRGLFVRFSDSGFAHDQGLLQFSSYEVEDDEGKTSWVYAPGASNHPLEIQRQEEANRRLEEKARRARGRGQ